MQKLFLFFVAMVTCRLLQVLQLFYTKTPNGDIFANVSAYNKTWIFWLKEVPIFIVICTIGSLFLFTKKTRKFATLFVVSAGCFYEIFCAINDQLLRWMGMHLDISFLKTYSIFKLDPVMAKEIAFAGIGSFILSIAIIILFVVAMIVIAKKVQYQKTSKKNAVIIILMCLIPAIISIKWPKCFFVGERIRPMISYMYSSIKMEIKNTQKPESFNDGIQFLGGNTNSEYPFYKFVANEDSVMNQFKQRAFENRPDIIIFTIGSLRGWTADFRIEKSCELMPNLCKLAQESAVFPYAYSVGFPSTEGLVGTMLGIWSHNYKVNVQHLVSKTTRALPEILTKAGYDNTFFVAAEPSFDNFRPWFTRWGKCEYSPDRTDDMAIAKRFVEVYKARPKNVPIFYDWLSFTTHTPFTVPESFETPATNIKEGYLQSLKFLDASLGIMLRAIEDDERANSTIIILTGDHSFPSGDINMTNRTWTPLTIKTPNVTPGINTDIASHVDIAPTILNLLNISASNHFVGRSLFDQNTKPKALSFIKWNASIRMDSVLVQGKIDDLSTIQFLRQSTNVDWDTTDIVDGFTIEKSIKVQDSATLSLKEKLNSSARAWSYILDTDKLYPRND